MDRTKFRPSGPGLPDMHVQQQEKSTGAPSPSIPAVRERQEPNDVASPPLMATVKPVGSEPELRPAGQLGARPATGASAAEKTAKIKEAMLRYFIDPKLQLADLRERVDGFYQQNADLRPLREQVLALIEHGKLPDLKPEDEDAFCCILGATLLLQRIDQALPEYKSENRYDFHPVLIKMAGKWANLLISPALIRDPAGAVLGANLAASQVREHATSLGRALLKTLSSASFLPPEQLVHRINDQSASWSLDESNPQWGESPISKRLYPVILRGNLGLYGHEANIYSISQGFTLLGMFVASYGVHGGTYKDPLAIYMHDLLHHRGMVGEDGNELASALLQVLCTQFCEIIPSSCAGAEGIQESARQSMLDFFAAHLLAHEAGEPNLCEDPRIRKNPSPRSAFDALFVSYLEELASLVGVKSELPELRQVRAGLDLQWVPLSKDDLVLRKKESITPAFMYDDISQLMSLKADTGFSRRLVPTLEAFSADCEKERRQVYVRENVEFGSDRLSAAGRAELRKIDVKLKDHIGNHYDRKEVFLAFRDMVWDFKNRVYDQLSDQPVDPGQFMDFVALGKALSS